MGLISVGAAAGNLSIVSQLLRAGADPNAPHESGPPLFWAAGSSNAPAMRALLDAGANPNATSQRGLTPLFMAAAVGATDCVRELAQRGASVNATALGAFTPLHVAAEGGHEGMVAALLEVRLFSSETARSCGGRLLDWPPWQWQLGEGSGASWQRWLLTQP